MDAERQSDWQIRQDREKQYGQSSADNHRNLGLAWTALIQQHYGIQLDHPIPASLAATMNAAQKSQRQARNPEKTDTLADLRNYATIAHEAGLIEEGAREVALALKVEKANDEVRETIRGVREAGLDFRKDFEEYVEAILQEVQQVASETPLRERLHRLFAKKIAKAIRDRQTNFNAAIRS